MRRRRSFNGGREKRGEGTRGRRRRRRAARARTELRSSAGLSGLELVRDAHVQNCPTLPLRQLHRRRLRNGGKGGGAPARRCRPARIRRGSFSATEERKSQALSIHTPRCVIPYRDRSRRSYLRETRKEEKHDSRNDRIKHVSTIDT